MNYWTYSIVFDKSLTIDALVELASRVPPYLISNDCKIIVDQNSGGFHSFDNNGDERFFRSVAEAIPVLAGSGGGGIPFEFQQDSLDFDFAVSPPRLRLSSGGGLRDSDVELEATIRAAFYWMCENLNPIFGSSEDLYTVENIWNQFGIEGWDGLTTVGSLEQEDIQDGRIPDILPWLSYLDVTRFAEAQGSFPPIGGISVESIGCQGLMIKLADYPWATRFLVRSYGGYQLVDQYARSLIDGEKRVPSHLDRVKRAIKDRKRAEVGSKPWWKF